MGCAHEQFLSFFYFQFLKILGRSITGIVLEHLTKPTVREIEFLGQFLDIDIFVKVFYHDDLRPLYLLADTVFFKDTIARYIADKPKYMHDDTRQTLLGGIFSTVGNFDGRLEELYQLGIETDFEHGIIGRNAGLTKPQLCHRPVEADVIFVPPDFLRRGIGMPLSGKKTQQSSFGKRLLRCTVGCKRPCPFCDIQQLELLQNPAFPYIEKVTRRVIFQRIMLSGLDNLNTDRIDIYTKMHIGLSRIEILNVVL